MANREVLIDTSVIVDFLRKRTKSETLLWRILSNHTCHISTVTLFELYAGASTSDKQLDVRNVAEWMTPIDLSPTIAMCAAEYYRQLRSQNALIEFRDLFIAATAVEFGFDLATLNVKHFTRIQGLSLLDLK